MTDDASCKSCGGLGDSPRHDQGQILEHFSYLLVEQGLQGDLESPCDCAGNAESEWDRAHDGQLQNKAFGQGEIRISCRKLCCSACCLG